MDFYYYACTAVRRRGAVLLDLVTEVTPSDGFIAVTGKRGSSERRSLGRLGHSVSATYNASWCSADRMRKKRILAPQPLTRAYTRAHTCGFMIAADVRQLSCICVPAFPPAAVHANTIAKGAPESQPERITYRLQHLDSIGP